MDLTRGETFSFLGFEFRPVRTRRGKWGVSVTPMGKAPKALRRKLKGVFRRNRSQSVEEVIDPINPILLGWGNYFRVGDSSRCLGYFKDWVKKKVRRHL